LSVDFKKMLGEVGDGGGQGFRDLGQKTQKANAFGIIQLTSTGKKSMDFIDLKKL
jgi:hypothetical protein